MKPYRPQKEARTVLNWAKESVLDVLPYKPSARYVFYRVLQEFGLKKTDVKRFEGFTRQARKRFWNGWRPDTLSDSVRKADIRGMGFRSPCDWFENFKEKECGLSKRLTQDYDEALFQDYYVEIHFEAQAMHGQFEHHTKDYYVPLIPYRGDASIPYKWDTAKRLENACRWYGKPLIILYFGDADRKGDEIPENALKDIRTWCKVDFKFIPCGLTREQAERLGVAENPEKPGEYQWEAVKDEDAKDMIISNLEEYWDIEIVQEVEAMEKEATKEWLEAITPVIDELVAKRDNDD